MVRDGMVFGTSVPNIFIYVLNIFINKELDQNLVVKDYLTTDADGNYCRQESSVIKKRITMLSIGEIMPFLTLLADMTKQMHKAFGAIGGKVGIMNAAKGAQGHYSYLISGFLPAPVLSARWEERFAL